MGKTAHLRNVGGPWVEEYFIGLVLHGNRVVVEVRDDVVRVLPACLFHASVSKSLDEAAEIDSGVDVQVGRKFEGEGEPVAKGGVFDDGV